MHEHRACPQVDLLSELARAALSSAAFCHADLRAVARHDCQSVFTTCKQNFSQGEVHSEADRGIVRSQQTTLT
jgi:hypothetical protein